MQMFEFAGMKVPDLEGFRETEIQTLKNNLEKTIHEIEKMTKEVDNNVIAATGVGVLETNKTSVYLTVCGNKDNVNVALYKYDKQSDAGKMHREITADEFKTIANNRDILYSISSRMNASVRTVQQNRTPQLLGRGIEEAWKMEIPKIQKEREEAGIVTKNTRKGTMEATPEGHFDPQSKKIVRESRTAPVHSGNQPLPGATGKNGKLSVTQMFMRGQVKQGMQQLKQQELRKTKSPPSATMVKNVKNENTR